MSENQYNIPDEALLEFRSILDEVAEKKAELAAAMAKLNKFRNSSSHAVAQSEKEYKTDWTQRQKIDFILRGGKLLNTTQITAEYMAHEPDANHERVKLLSAISATMSAHSKGDKHYIKLKDAQGSNVYKLK